MISYLRKRPLRPDEVRGDTAATGRLLEDGREAIDALAGKGETSAKELLQACREAGGTLLESGEAPESFLDNVPAVSGETANDRPKEAPRKRSRRRNSRASGGSTDKTDNDGKNEG
jgi:hypothetical protein